jgi:ferrochelatase
MPAFDNILLVAFGGPTPGCCKRADPCPGEAFCFVQGILGADPKRAARVKEVAGHYEEIGGFSPFNALTFSQAEALRKTLAERGIHAPLRVGMRHWTPWIADAVAEIARAGQRRTLALILAPHQSAVSWDWYQQVVSEACAALGKDAPRVAYVEPWPVHPGYVEAVADGVRSAVRSWEDGRFDKACLVFTAHAIPEAVAKKAPYASQFAGTAAAAAAVLGKSSHRLAYQSQASDASIPWTGPDINDLIRDAAGKGVKDIVASPAGFLCDHVEVLYDLDIAARRTAAACGVTLTRAPTVGSHPAFIGMLADLISSRFSAEAAA